MNKKIEDMLYNYTTMKAEIQNLEIEIKYVQNSFFGCKAISYGNESCPTNKFNSCVENEILTKEKIINNLNKKCSEKKMIMDKLDNAINNLPEKSKDLIYIRYIDGRGLLSWAEVADKLYISEIRCYQMKNQIIKSLEKTFFVSDYSDTIEKL